METEILIKLLFTLSILGCASNHTRPNSSVSDGMASASQAKDHDFKSQSTFQLQSELTSIDGQIAYIDGMIVNARLRIQSDQMTSMPGTEGRMAGVQAEIFGYEAQKQNLIFRKMQIEATLLQNQ